LIAQAPEALPGFARLMAGASTLNARTDPDFTVTLPNHTCMLTGRFVLGPAGHGWVENEDPPEGLTLSKNKGGYVAGIFDVAHDRGLRTAFFAGKTKFSLYEASWNAENGAPDTVGDDQGRKKIDEYLFTEKLSEITDGVLRNLKLGTTKSLVFVHFATPDLTAHAYGWDVTPGSRYLKAVAAVDHEIARLLDAIQADELLRGKTAVVLTADHGGGAPFRSHDQTRMWVDYIIPFLVWTGDGGTPRDLYAINARTRADPGLAQVRPGANGSDGKPLLPPIRNGDAGNLVLSLLLLPPVPGSTINAEQDLRVFPEH
jgi:predicted AlkP superfamily pyrophosphatase or phosphodiesterase